ncbi:MAG: hypothetical protein F6J87_26735, partial [Spirulina sp. SIO3F2]|nr:hypothetical protein [Spirulina sp. SIO3F2]
MADRHAHACALTHRFCSEKRFKNFLPEVVWGIDLQNPDLRQAFTTEIRSHFTLAHPNRRLNISHSVIQGDWPT